MTIHAETDDLFASEDGSTATIGWTERATAEQVKELIDLMSGLGYTWVHGEYEDAESGFTFIEVER